jgi:hypothetical protein
MTHTITLTSREAGVLQDLLCKEVEDLDVHDDAAHIQVLECISAKITDTGAGY